jgi:hypothetical protein
VKRRTIAAIGAAGLLVAFIAAVFLYERREAEEADARSALHHAPPFVRDGAPALGPEDARVVLVEFFDPGCESCRVFAGPVKEIAGAGPDAGGCAVGAAVYVWGAELDCAVVSRGRAEDARPDCGGSGGVSAPGVSA